MESPHSVAPDRLLGMAVAYHSQYKPLVETELSHARGLVTNNREILTTYGSHQVKSAYVIDIIMILHTAFMMSLDLEIGCETTVYIY